MRLLKFLDRRQFLQNRLLLRVVLLIHILLSGPLLHINYYRKKSSLFDRTAIVLFGSALWRLGKFRENLGRLPPLPRHFES